MEKRIAEIIARCQAIDTLQADIERKAELENEGAFTPESREAYSALKTEYDTLIAEKKQLEADAEMKASRSGRAVELQPKVIARKTESGAGAPLPEAVKPGTPVDSNAGDPTITSRPKFTIPAQARRGGNPRNFHGVKDGMTPDERAYRLGMWALSRIGLCLPQYAVPAANHFVNNYMGGIRNTAHGESDGVTGGQFLVPEEFSSDMIILRETYGVARRLFARSTMTSDTKHEPKRLTGLTAYFVGESQVGTESNMTWQDVLLVAKDVMALTRMTNQLSADAAINVGDTLAGEISYAFTQKEDDCAFNGNGGSSYGGIQGILNALVNCDGANTASAGAVTQGSSNTWATMVLADFDNVAGKLPQFADTPNTCWVAHKTFYASVMQKLELAGGGNTIREIAEGDRRPRPTFLGYPVEFSQVFPSATATTGIMAILGDLNLSSIFGDRQQDSISFSESATIGGESVFERNQIAVRGTERFDINNHGCGTASVVGAVVGLRTG